ncbi:TetR/AcrR family transcriptional regulator [Mycobacterium sp. SMC-8]|uniref:TetR/AcrR family transcriptional regulator n=1 Tax=Mycobacterium sp. SMC-8 TaxID=2857060 RepID=UPI0021B30458|nr:TetR/AcrR family transcriptional regulator [Mycobacterium sp. SMC-8]UXA11469.1 TetR/AcrR family transcriptional regulator [Mycobacterium sp. SMC-8]
MQGLITTIEYESKNLHLRWEEMTEASPISIPDGWLRDGEGSVLDRLVRAADLTLQRDGVEGVTIDAIALSAGVSRATAFRHLGKRDDMVVTVALSRSRRFIAECSALMARYVGTFAKLEAAFVYLVRELADDPIIRELFSLRTSDDLGPGTYEMAVATLGPPVEEGRQAGDIRSDVSRDQIIAWIIEQLYLAIQHHDRSETAVRHRVREFLVPALAANRQQLTSATMRARIVLLETSLSQAAQALEGLKGELPRPAPDEAAEG